MLISIVVQNGTNSQAGGKNFVDGITKSYVIVSKT